MKIVLPGGTGHLGIILCRTFVAAGHEVVVLTRNADAKAPIGARSIEWDGRIKGAWWEEIDGSDAVINLAGRTVNCRYTKHNLQQMMNSRIYSARSIGEAIRHAVKAPKVWLQMSTATIYAHRHDVPNDEETGIIGGQEADAPTYWGFSVDIARAWERAQDEADTPYTRKVALRTAIVMSPEKGGAFHLLFRLARCGLGGPVAGGHQYVSWIHDRDYVRAVQFLIEREDIAGPVNIAAPNPIPQREFMATLRQAAGCPIGLPATKWMTEIGAFILHSDSELLLKSRRVIPGRLLNEGFSFTMPDWPSAARDLVARTKEDH